MTTPSPSIIRGSRVTCHYKIRSATYPSPSPSSSSSLLSPSPRSSTATSKRNGPVKNCNYCPKIKTLQNASSRLHPQRRAEPALVPSHAILEKTRLLHPASAVTKYHHQTNILTHSTHQRNPPRVPRPRKQHPPRPRPPSWACRRDGRTDGLESTRYARRVRRSLREGEKSFAGRSPPLLSLRDDLNSAMAYDGKTVTGER